MRDGVFISHAHGDGDLAIALTELVQEALGLNESRITCTSDERYGLASGQPLKEQIEKHLQSAAVVILVSSPRTRDRDWVKFECGYASGQQIPLHVVIPTDDDLETVPEPYQGNISTMLSHGTDVIKFVRDLAAALPGGLGGPGVQPDALARLLEAARKREVETLKAAADRKLADSDSRHRDTVRLAWGLLALSLVGGASAAWWARGQTTEITARSEGECAIKLSKQTLELSEACNKEMRRFSLHGRLTLKGAPLSDAELAVFHNVASENKPVATDRTDNRGEYAFKEGDLADVDPKEPVDLVVKHPRFQGQSKLAKITPQAARLDVNLE